MFINTDLEGMSLWGTRGHRRGHRRDFVFVQVSVWHVCGDKGNATALLASHERQCEAPKTQR
jgi:hypothetical protein